MEIPFYKYHGAGNDFIIIDIRNNTYPFDDALVHRMCHRRFGIGADGLMLLESAAEPCYGFAMRYFNADGLEGSMCGNGGRCIAAFAHSMGIENLNFTATDGPHVAELLSVSGDLYYIRLKMKEVNNIQNYSKDMYYLNTGSPHLVLFVNDLERYPVREQGAGWRRHPDFEGGLNVNFVERRGRGHIAVRTYERGVEDETWACGTGATASAIVSAYMENNDCCSWEVAMKGGLLKVDFIPREGRYTEVFLSGPAQQVFAGKWPIPNGL